MLIQMDNFPYVSKDEVKDSKGKIFCLIKSVQKGNAEDSFGGYLMQQAQKNKKTGELDPIPNAPQRIVMGRTNQESDGQGLGEIPEGPGWEEEVMVQGPLGVASSQEIMWQRTHVILKRLKIDGEWQHISKAVGVGPVFCSKPFDFLVMLTHKAGLKWNPVQEIEYDEKTRTITTKGVISEPPPKPDDEPDDEPIDETPAQTAISPPAKTAEMNYSPKALTPAQYKIGLDRYELEKVTLDGICKEIYAGKKNGEISTMFTPAIHHMKIKSVRNVILGMEG